MGVAHPTHRENVGKTLGRKHLNTKLSERRGAFARKKRQGKRAVRKGARIRHEAARARSRLDKHTFGMFNVRTAAVNGGYGIGHIETLLRDPVLRRIVMSLDCRTELPKSWHLDMASISAVIPAESKAGKESTGLD